jgi:hypothetical protein
MSDRTDRHTQDWQELDLLLRGFACASCVLVARNVAHAATKRELVAKQRPPH